MSTAKAVSAAEDDEIIEKAPGENRKQPDDKEIVGEEDSTSEGIAKINMETALSKSRNELSVRGEESLNDANPTGCRKTDISEDISERHEDVMMSSKETTENCREEANSENAKKVAEDSGNSLHSQDVIKAANDSNDSNEAAKYEDLRHVAENSREVATSEDVRKTAEEERKATSCEDVSKAAEDRREGAKSSEDIRMTVNDRREASNFEDVGKKAEHVRKTIEEARMTTKSEEVMTTAEHGKKVFVDKREAANSDNVKRIVEITSVAANSEEIIKTVRDGREATISEHVNNPQAATEDTGEFMHLGQNCEAVPEDNSQEVNLKGKQREEVILEDTPSHDEGREAYLFFGNGKVVMPEDVRKIAEVEGDDDEEEAVEAVPGDTRTISLEIIVRDSGTMSGWLMIQFIQYFSYKLFLTYCMSLIRWWRQCCRSEGLLFRSGSDYEVRI